jgi:dihydrodipicolinate synthase/N-acetylneuraminate lyase
MPVIGGTGAPSAGQAERVTAAARDNAADGLLALTPLRLKELAGERLAHSTNARLP